MHRYFSSVSSLFKTVSLLHALFSSPMIIHVLLPTVELFTCFLYCFGLIFVCLQHLTFKPPFVVLFEASQTKTQTPLVVYIVINIIPCFILRKYTKGVCRLGSASLFRATELCFVIHFRGFFLLITV